MTIKQMLGRMLCVGTACVLMSCSAEAPAPHVTIVQPADGATLSSPFKVVMAVDGMTVHAAGDIVPGTGHFHLILDNDYFPMGEIIPKDHEHLHYGKGQTEAELRMYPGKHTLTLQFANGHHKSYGKALSQTITVNVK
ncbi:MAG: DUF4399 domain-containing protein [Mariprofundus sp.]